MPARRISRSLRLGASSIILLAAACSGSDKSAAPMPAQPIVDAAVDAGPLKVATQTFGELEPWASPIDDYIAVGKKVQPKVFNSAIVDLMPFGTRLFIGYGDANYNLGANIPIEFRYFASAEDPTATGLTIDAEGQGEKQKTPLQSGEEQIDRYRVLDGELWQAGIDSTDPDELWTQARTDPKSIQGNVYRLDGDKFRKHRSITGGEHVHDLASFQGAIYGVGSGADFRTEFEAGEIFRYLWRSTDRGATFSTVKRVQCSTPGDSDTRWVHLLSTPSKLFMFGYDSTFSTNTTKVKNAVFDGQSVTDLGAGAPLQKIFPHGTLSFGEGAVLWGLDIASGSPKPIVASVDANGAVSPMASFDGLSIIDVSLTDTGEILYLVQSVPLDTPNQKHWDVTVLAADVVTPGTTTEVKRFSLDVQPSSFAYFGGALFVGMADGRVLRASVTK